MDKIRIRQNYENYDRVKNTFKVFIRALVWESMDIDAGVEENEINTHIAKYCDIHGDEMISLMNQNVTKFIKSLESRYEVHLYELNENDDVIEERHFDTDNLKLAFEKAASFYRTAKCPQVNIYDNETAKYIAEWD